jgi:drug/metabolite transporter (DMT)-like permease
MLPPMNPGTKTPSNLAPALLVAAVLLWSGNFIAGRAMGDSVSALGLNVWRWSLAFAVLVPLASLEMRRHARDILAAWKYLAMLGLTGVAAFHFFVYKALEHTAATNALLVLSTAPALIMLLSRVVLRDSIAPHQWLGIVVSFAGALVLICRGDMEALHALQPGRGEMWMLAAVPAWAVYSVLLKMRPQALPQRSTLTVSTAMGLLWMAPLVAASPGALQVPWTPALAAGIGYIAIGASVVAFLCWNRGVALVGPARAGVYIHLMPLFGAALAFVLLGEALRLYHALGAALVFAGVALTQSRINGRFESVLARLPGITVR